VTRSVRIFIVDPDDTLYRFAGTKFTNMFNDPESHPLLRFAGQRVRMVEVIVELRNRVPCGIARLVYEMLRFDDQGRLDCNALKNQNFALADTFAGEETKDAVVVDASSRFIAQGGRWTPSYTLAQRICQVALGEAKCSRL